MSNLTPRGRMAKVWPLVEGMRGSDREGNQVELVPGKPGLMLLREALEREKRGELQLMAGKTYAELRQPQLGKKAQNRVVLAEAPEDLDSVPDEDQGVEQKIPQRRKKRTYKRRDIVAEKPR